MKFTIEIDEAEMKQLIISYIRDILDDGFSPSQLQILVKSKQNLKSEWEQAAFKAVYNGVSQ